MSGSAINSVQAEELGLGFGVRGMLESNMAVVCPAGGRGGRGEAWEQPHHEEWGAISRRWQMERRAHTRRNGISLVWFVDIKNEEMVVIMYYVR
jgi:hypothetical protein